jgi:biotin carboxyl carrier protein
MIYKVKIDDKSYQVSIDQDSRIAYIDQKRIPFNFTGLSDGNHYSLLIENKIYNFFIERSEQGLDICYGSVSVHAEISDEKTERFKNLMGASREISATISLKAPMPGLVLKIEVEPGQLVKKGDGLVIIEAMKMENELKAHSSVTVKEIKVKPGQPVEKNQVLILFE